MSITAALLHATLAAPGGRWFSGLAVPLAQTRWRLVTEATGLDRHTYGTGRYLAGNVGAWRDDLARLELPLAFAAPGPITVETLHGEARDRYAGLGLDFHRDGEADAGLVCARLGEAFERIAQVPGAAEAVGSVLAVLHVARPEGPDYDVSYSDPALPFSIFVGIEGATQPNGDLRLAEGILHECMHLQLTLIEGTIPIISGADEQHYSPWQAKMRPSQGVLHGMYVFRVIQDFHRALLDAGSLLPAERAHLARRIDTIEEEFATVSEFAQSSDLTPTGRRLASALLAAG